MTLPSALREELAAGADGALALSLLAALEAHHPQTADHSLRVGTVARQLARALGADGQTERLALLAGLLHDVGKLHIPSALLASPRALSPGERLLLDRHPMLGARILADLGFPLAVIEATRDHHERWDGQGYPARRQGDETALLARLVGVADAFIAMIEPGRPYRPRRRPAEALAEVSACAGRDFDPGLAALLIETLGQTPPEPEEAP